MRNLAVEIDRLETEGVRFSIAICGDGYVARVGDYLKGPAPSQRVRTVEEAIQWISSIVSLPRRTNWSN
ncbi:MAG TPA: hypothetical protein VFP91_10885 [Vicinamibacterales bacterium]|nr:hypothetical protein [Vicinamibacterales bacterium]